jgi:hypothetical protein
MDTLLYTVPHLWLGFIFPFYQRIMLKPQMRNSENLLVSWSLRTTTTWRQSKLRTPTWHDWNVLLYIPHPCCLASASNKRSITLGPRQLSNLSETNSIPYASHRHSRLEEAQCMRIKITWCTSSAKSSAEASTPTWYRSQAACLHLAILLRRMFTTGTAAWPSPLLGSIHA